LEVGGDVQRIKKALQDKRGASFPLIVAITLALALIFCGVSEYFRLMIIAQGVRDAMQAAVISTVNDNYDDVYHGVREGYSGAYQPIAGDFEESLDYGDIYDRIDRILGLTGSGGYHNKSSADGGLEFRVWNLSVDIRNAPLASGDQAPARFEADSIIMLEVPVSFAGKRLPPMQIRVKNTAGFIPTF
jgi:hypothetical protein